MFKFVCYFSISVRKMSIFLIYNADHDKCITVDGSSVTATSCDPAFQKQMWHWTPYGQLQNNGSKECLTSPDQPQDWAQVKLMSCNPDNSNQKWSCAGNFLRLNNSVLNLNFGNIQGGDRVVLFRGTGVWSEWKVFGEEENVCVKRKGMSSCKRKF